MFVYVNFLKIDLTYLNFIQIRKILYSAFSFNMKLIVFLTDFTGSCLNVMMYNCIILGDVFVLIIDMDLKIN